MKSEVKIPEVGESISEVTIGQWLKEDGEHVDVDEVICEIESEKATLEIRADKVGKLKILVNAEETVPVGEKIAEIDTEAEGEEAGPSEEKKKAPEKEEKKQVKEEAKKAEPAEEEVEEAAGEGPSEEEETVPEEEAESRRISPVASKMLKEAGISPEKVKGSGAGGRVTKSDAQDAIESAEESAKKAPKEGKAEERREAKEEKEAEEEKAPQPQVVGEPQPKFMKPSGKPEGERTENRKKMSTLRKTIARRLVAAKNETAMLTTFNEVDMSAIMKTRAAYKDAFQEKYGIRLGFMSFFVRACCIALKEFPQVNATLEEDEIVFHDYCDISIAVSTPKGLVVPVIFNAEEMSLAHIEAYVAHLAEKARDNKLTIEEMTGGTFSITNGGVFGSLLSTPILNTPQSAILGMHKIEERPVVINGEIVIRPMMYVALSYDHRIIDGKESVSFLVRLKELLEDPSRMLLEI